jgi:hypothetical protein
MMRVKVTFIRTLTLEETFEVATLEEANERAEERYGELSNSDFYEADGEWDIEQVENEK